MHDTFQLQKIGRKDEDFQKANFLGVYAADQIPKKLPPNACFIVNTDPISKSGTHWLAFYKKGDLKIFFDSYGQSLSKYKEVQKHSIAGWKRRDMDLQQFNSDVCGDYCLIFLKSVATNEGDLDFFYKMFDAEDREGNDELVFSMAHSYYPNILNETPHDVDLDGVYDRPRNVKCQGCKSRK